LICQDPICQDPICQDQRLASREFMQQLIQGLQRIVICPEQRQGQQLTLTEQQHHYLYQVLRLRTGGKFIVLDRGSWWLAELQATPTTAKILEQLPIQTELAVPITLIAALPKGNGFDSVVTQVTELGVAEILPVLSERTLLQPSTQRLQRWQRLAVEAAEQSCRQQVPTIQSPVPAAQLWSNLQFSTQKYICTPTASTPLLSHLHQLPPLAPEQSCTGIAIAIGPEGGWTAAELDLAIAQEFVPVSLGARVLRAVTAAPTAVAIISAHLEERVYFQSQMLTFESD
jgi:16S rRNA (uracil1498-N3)-methyltransferase